MTLPVVHSSGGAFFGTMSSWEFRTKEAAQLPKTYPIQLGLAYLLLVRAPDSSNDWKRICGA